MSAFYIQPKSIIMKNITHHKPRTSNGNIIILHFVIKSGIPIQKQLLSNCLLFRFNPNKSIVWLIC